MKKLISAGLLFILMVMLYACSGKTDLPKSLTKEGIAPYELSESENYILQSFGMIDTSQIISFNAPKEAVGLSVNVYRLEFGQKWNNIGGGGISLGADRAPDEKLDGIFTMQLKENHAIDFNVTSMGMASFKSNEIIYDTETMISTKKFLDEFQELEINKEIPVALMVYDSGTSMRSCFLQDYFEPSVFDGMDLVQAVTLTFTDK